jgi:PAS domain S-box-containing protein
MNKTLRVLHVEDQERDAALLTRHLSKAGYELASERVETPEAMRAALETQEWDVILCDYSMPHFDALSALALLKETGLELPFIIISGTIGEEVAVEAMRAGANDYLMKDKLARLAPTIERELHEAENRRARQRAEQALKGSEAEMRALFEAMTDVILVLDAEGRHLKMAPTRSASLYKPAAERIGKTVHEVFPKEIADLFIVYLRHALDEGRTQHVEYSLSINGREIWFEGSVSPMTSDSVIWVARDITERKDTERQLRLQATALQSAANAIVITDRQGIISWVNHAFTKLTGYTLEDVLGQSTNILKSGVHDAAFYVTLWDTILSGKVWHGEITNLRKDGSLYVEEQTITPVLSEADEIINFIAIKQDITERKQAEAEKTQLTEQIENHRQRLNNIVASVPGVVWEAWGQPEVASQRIDFVSDHVETMLGYSVEEWLSTPNFWLTIVHPDDRDQTAADAAAIFAGARGNNSQEFRWIGKDGHAIWVQAKSAVISDDQGRPAGMRGVNIDITDRKRAEEMSIRRAGHASLRADISAALAESDTPLTRILERSAEAMVQHLGAAFARIWTLNKVENVLEMQASAGLYTHLDGPHARVPVGAFKIGLIAEERQPHITNEVQTDPWINDKEWAMREGMTAFAGYPLIVEDRLVGVMAMFAREDLADDTLDALASIADIISQGIERKRVEEALQASEEQLRQSQKLEAIGMLAGGIAHDFNNLLTVILGYSDITLMRLNKEDPLHRNITEITKAADRAAGLTRQLLAFSRKQVMQPKVLDLNVVVSELEKMLRRLIGEDMALRTVLEPELGSIKADPGQIEQIIMNLAVNARDAMPEGGKLTIETSNVYLDEDYAKAHVAVIPGPYVMLAVSDSGTGMDQQTQARMFEPFFTTKEKGKGTGLGLSTVYGIVKQSGGNVWVYSEVGRGTTFKIYLPRVDEGVQESERSQEIIDDRQGSETILLAEDEEAVRTLARHVLEMHGYQVLEAANGGAALLICERHKESIQLLITDVIMPEMSGRELAERLAQLRPDMKVLFMSGYTDNAIVHQGVLDEGANFIQKPFPTEALAQKVREVLDAPQTSL